MKKHMLSNFTKAALLACFLIASPHIEGEVPQTSKVDLAFTYLGERSLRADLSQNFWMQGGSLELGTNVWHGWGVAADVTGTHSSSVGTSNIPLSLVTATFGPRYRWHADHLVSAYGQALIGEANGFGSFFPTPAGAQSSANSLALQVGGGLDGRLGSHMSLRVLEATWVRTQLPNATNDVQNILRLGAGCVVRFGR